MKEELAEVGAVRIRAAIDPEIWFSLIDSLPKGLAGVRLYGLSVLQALLATDSVPMKLGSSLLGEAAKPIRAIVFNKTAANNWPLGWHQDRTIAVAAKHDTQGYGPWSIKQGIHHVEPPFAVIESMITMRIHLDTVDNANAPLRVAPGSHKLGRLPIEQYDTVVNKCGSINCHADAGDIWLYATPILHASHRAEKPTNRRVVQVDYAAIELPLPLV